MPSRARRSFESSSSAAGASSSPGTLFYSLYFTAYLVLLGFAPDLMGKEVIGSSPSLCSAA